MSKPVTPSTKTQTPAQKPSCTKKFFKTLGLLARCRFADAAEYMIDGDTEN